MIVTRALLMAALAMPAVAAAQARVSPRTPPRPQPRAQAAPAKPKPGLRGYVIAGSSTLAAEQTFDAVGAAHSRPVFGGGVQVTNIWKGLFADVGASQLTVDGRRVFVDDGQVFDLGIPLTVTMRPLDFAGGWRLGVGPVSPYAGVGVTYLSYEESSSFADSDEDVTERRAGLLVLVGADVRVWRWIHAGGDFRWRRVRGILGEGGASGAFGEDDAGGFAAAVRMSIGR